MISRELDKEIKWVIESLSMLNKKWYNLYLERPEEERNIIKIVGISEGWLTIQVFNQAHLTDVIDFLRFMEQATSLRWRLVPEELEITFDIFS